MIYGRASSQETVSHIYIRGGGGGSKLRCRVRTHQASKHPKKLCVVVCRLRLLPPSPETRINFLIPRRVSLGDS